MPNLNIQAEDIKFSLDFVSVTGLSGPSPTFTIRAEVSTPIFDLDGNKVFASHSVPGAIKLHTLTSKLASLGETEQQVKAHNATVLENSFNLGSEHFCFKSNDLQTFFNVPTGLICFKGENGNFYRGETSLVEQVIHEAFTAKIHSLKDNLTTGNLPQIGALLSQLSSLAYN